MKLAEFFFKYRSYTPIPLILVLLYQADPQMPWIIIGLLLLFAGEGIRFWAILHAGGATRTRKVGAPSLVTSGPYGHVRNPLYLGNMLIYAGIVFVASGPWMWELLIISILFFSVQYTLIVSLEEKTLLDIFGDQYRKYSEHVNRLVPRLTPWHLGDVDDTSRLAFGEAIRPEKSTLLNIGIMLLLILVKWLIFLT